MSTWEEILAEKKEMSPAEIRKAGEAALKDERAKNKKDAETKDKKSEYTKYLKKQLKFKVKKYEDQKKKELEDIKKRGIERHKEGIKKALSSVKTDTISSRDPEGTAYAKALGNVGSLAGGVAKAAAHGIAYGLAKRKAAKEAQKAQQAQIEKKEKKSPGRPKRETTPEVSATPATQAAAPVRTQKQLPPAPERKQLSAVQPQKQLPPSGGLSRDVRRQPKAKTLGQRARQNPKVKAGLIQQRMGEGYSDWRNELILEKNLIIEVDDKKSKKDAKEKIIDVMKGENKIDLNPKINEAYKDEEGGMAQNELSTIEKSVKSLRKKIKSETQQLPAWVQSKISKAADYIDTVADYMDGDPEPVKESYDEGDETFRQHSKETFSSYKPSESRKRTAGVLKLMKQMNVDVEKPKKKKKKKAIAEDCGCDKKNLVIAMFKKAVSDKKRKNYQLNNEIIGEASAAWQRKEGKNPTGGLNKKGIASYRREHPGSHLSLAVTTKPSKLKKGSKKWKRRKSFCARMSGMPGPMKDEKGRPTRKALSLRKWNC